MCSICLHSPCLSGCPNAPDPTPVTYCRSCGEPIIPGDEYADIDGEAWCEGCLDDLPLCVLIPKLGWEWKTVQEGENVQCVDCKCCGDTEPLPVGTEYGEIDGDAFCEECLEDTPLSDLVLENALEACARWGLHFDAVNDSLPSWKKFYGNETRKVGATEYWDDKAYRVQNGKLMKEAAHEME